MRRAAGRNLFCMRRIFVGLIALVVLSPVGAKAETSPAAAITAWVAGIDASPEWSAGFLTLSYDEAAKAAKISGLTFRSERGGFTITFDNVTVTGYVPAADGSFTATSVRAGGGTAEIGTLKVGLTDVEVSDIAVPALAAVTYDPAKPFTSQLRALAALARIKLGLAKVGTLSLIQQFEGISSRVAYQNLAIENVSGGKIAAMRAGPLTMQSPATEGLAGIRVATAEIRDVDLNAFIHVYDPDAYAGGVGDLAWRQAIGHAGYRDFAMEVPGIKIGIGEIGVDKFSLRQPKASFTGYLDRRMTRSDNASTTHDPEDEASLASLLSALGVGRMSIDRLAIDAIGIDKLGFAGLHLTAVSSDVIGEFGIDGFEAAIEGEGSVKFGHLAVGNIKLPGAEAMIAALRTAEDGGNVDFSSLAPLVGYAEAGDVFVNSPDFPRVALARFRADIGAYVGRIPTAISAALSGLDIPTRLLPNRMASDLLIAFGYDRVAADTAMKLAWNESTGTATLSDFRFDMKDMGTLTGSAAVSGVTRQTLQQSGSLLDALPGAMFTGGTFAFKDNSLVDRGLAYRAKAANADPEKLRKQLATAVPFMLGFLGNPDFQKQLGPVLKAFLLSPGTITAKLAPPSPVAIPTISETVRTAPETLPKVLGVTVTGEPGAAPAPEKASVPAAEKPIAPAPAKTPEPPAIRPAVTP
jgi:hypothetical protein